MDTQNKPGQVLETVASLIHEVMGDAPLEPITRETSFHDDLALESIEFVALAEKLEARYGKQVDLARWLAGKDLDALLALRVGDVVELVERCP